MAIRTKTTVKSFFETGDAPTGTEFADLIDSYVQHPNAAGFVEVISTASSVSRPSETLVAIATAVQGGATGVLEIQSTTAVTGLPVGAMGRTILATTVASSVRTAISAQSDVITTQGDIVQGDGSGQASRLAVGSARQVLNISGGAVAWTTIVGLTEVTSFSSAGTHFWIRPAGVTKIFVTVVAGGGGGGDGGANVGGAAGGGETRMGVIEVSALSTVTAVVGAGGSGGTGNGDGANGTDSSFGSFITAVGASGGTGNAGAAVNGGFGGSGGFISIPGSPGQPRDNADSRSGNGGSSTFGPGGTGATGGSANGQAPVGGAGGGGSGSQSSGTAGGNGAAGIVIIQY